nr:hypothetical protein [Gemmatimonadota bacterium]
MTRMLRRCLSLSLLLTTGACFHYVPGSDATPRGARVRVELTRPTPVELREVTANSVTNVSGEVVSSASDRLVLSVFALRAAGGFEYLSGGETVIFPNDVVGRVEERRISPVRTALAAALVGAAVYAISATLGGSSGGGEPG